MPTDMYSDAPEQASAPGKEAAPDDGHDGASAVLPKSILGGKDFKVGQEIVLKIDAIHDDEVQVSYSHGDDEGGEGGGEEAPPEEAQAEAKAPDNMASMMQ